MRARECTKEAFIQFGYPTRFLTRSSTIFCASASKRHPWNASRDFSYSTFRSPYLRFLPLYSLRSSELALQPGSTGSFCLKCVGFLAPEKTPSTSRSKKVLMMCIISGQKSQIMSNLFKTDRGDQWLMPVALRGWFSLSHGWYAALSDVLASAQAWACVRGAGGPSLL
jgi:hypothetical protein